MRRPNLVHILSDQHARRVAGCYGDRIVATPNLDRIAREGVTFDNAYCNSPICLPSRMAALTARHPHRLRTWTNEDMLASDVPTVAHALGAAGYDTILVGRMHALGPDQMHGYARREIGDHSPNWPGVPRHDMGPLALANDPHRESLERSGPGSSAYELKDVDATARATAIIRELGAARRGGEERPFAMTVGLMLPHPPYVAAPADYARYAGRVPPPRLGPPPPAAAPPWIAWWRANRRLADATEEEVARARAAYWGLVESLDRMVGDILRALDDAGLADDTLVVYASDHGDHLGERGLWWKHTMYDESAAIPLLMRWPGRLPAGERRGQVVDLMDVTATMLDAMGAPALPHADGRSFLPVAVDAAAPWRDEIFCEYCMDERPAWSGGVATFQRMVRTDRWKCVVFDAHAPLLFDMANDPDERRDLAGDPAHAEVLRKLVARLRADWDPDAIAAEFARRRPERDLLARWARETRPASTHLWPMTAGMNRLDR